MFKLRFAPVLLALMLFSLALPPVHADDGIPDNCEYPYGAYYRLNVFPRYEPQNRRLLLVDWSTGADVGVLATNLDDTLIRAWSTDCRYLAVATGNADSRATAVYDTVDLHYVGDVPGARIVAHPITWGPGDFLMVEGRKGAVLWNVPANIQYPLDVGFNTTTYRNFSRLRWDADKHEVTANLANGGRIIYDLNTGNPTVVNSITPGQITLGGQTFSCLPEHYKATGGSRIGEWLRLLYASSGGVFVLDAGFGAERDSVATLEANASSLKYMELGWSINCRYIAAEVASTDRDNSYDTVIWDVLAGKRVGTFANQWSTEQQLTWDTAEKRVLIETGDGAYLWNLETGQRLQVSSDAQLLWADCHRTCYWSSFKHVYWDSGRQQMLGVPIQSPNAVVAYDVNTGTEVTRYTVDNATEPVDFMTSGDSRLLLTYANGRLSLWNRELGAVITFPFDFTEHDDYMLRSIASISTDDHYLALFDNNVMNIYDLTTLTEGGAPMRVYDQLGYYFRYSRFINGDTLDVIYYGSTVRLNVATGELTGIPAVFDPQAQQAQTFSAIPGVSGWGGEADESQPQCPVAARYDEKARQILVHDGTTHSQRLIEANVNSVRTLLLSPDCKTIYAAVFRMNTSMPYEQAGLGANLHWYTPADGIFWDVASGQRVAQTDSFWHVYWNPSGNRAFVETSSGYELVDPAGHAAVPVTFQDTDNGSLPEDLETYWDQKHGLVLVAGHGEVFAIDMNTGRERLRFPAREDQRGGCYRSRYSGCGMGISKDGNWVFVYGLDTLGVWNIETAAHTTLPILNPAGSSDGASISPDGHYLIMSRDLVRVWDLTQLPADIGARKPFATYNLGGGAARFVDNDTIEVRSGTDDAPVTTRYNVATGAVVR